MKKIILVGAGRSATVLIDFLADRAVAENYFFVLADREPEIAKKKLAGRPQTEAAAFDVKNLTETENLLTGASVLISLLPPDLHINAAKICVKMAIPFISASYETPEMLALDEAAKKAGIPVINELGLDPGIDHLSAKEVIDRLKAEGAKLTAFRSYCGGLLAPQYENNPWKYKFTWSPRNVVMAGQGGTARYLQKGQLKYVPKHRVFNDLEELSVEGYGEYEGYPNRDSLTYRTAYGLDGIQEIKRGTLRRKGFSYSWQVFVSLGLTDDSFVVEGSENMSCRAFVNSFLPYDPERTVEQKIADFLACDLADERMKKLEWAGLFSEQKIGLKEATPAQILQHLLEQKWQLAVNDKDMIVMQHIFEYEKAGENFKLTSSMVVEGENDAHTAMAKTVGLPPGITALLILKNELKISGAVLPVMKELYEKLLPALAENGIRFTEKTEKI